MLDRITGMQIFARSAATGSLSAAARQLDLSPAMAAKHVDALEQRLGVKLLHRSTRKLTLTEAGQQYLDACLKLLPELEEVEASIASQRVLAQGLLRLNTPLSFGVKYIAPLLKEFNRLHPLVTVDLGLNDRVVDLLEEGWDLTIRVGKLKDTGLVARKLADAEMIVCAAPEYWASHGSPATWADLSAHNCLSFTLSNISRPAEWRFGKNAEHSVKIQGSLRTNNGDALVAAAISGLGVLYEPAFIVADGIRRGDLVPLRLDVESAELGGIHILRSANRAPPAKVRVMIDFLLSAFGANSPWLLK
ncbi:LysR family transcriptional regulator [Herbaspirillum autotrophicum]|uniref:LysR family transcriptional regulator n=1 Tax=Herbaspirillum autotrophicum TaxID=180195 RepID=UPI00067D0F7C|nr:LysR family transcriptional regulator [Herbaspirillum autotrophicum]